MSNSVLVVGSQAVKAAVVFVRAVNLDSAASAIFHAMTLDQGLTVCQAVALPQESNLSRVIPSTVVKPSVPLQRQSYVRTRPETYL
jgi:hypothetical protein